MPTESYHSSPTKSHQAEAEIGSVTVLAPRKQYGLRLRVRLMRELRHLAVDKDKNLNDLVEEAIADLLKKHHGRKKELH